VQLHFGLDSLLSGPVNVRLQAMGETLSRQLNERPPSEWTGILESTAASYHVQLALFRNDGKLVAGVVPNPPPEVLKRIADARPPEGQRNGPPQDQPPRDGEFGDFQPNPDARHATALVLCKANRGAIARPARGDPPSRPRRPAAPGGRRFSQVDPAHVGAQSLLGLAPHAHAGSHDPSAMPITLALATPSLRGGGLLFDFTPWLIGGGAVFALSVLMWLPLVRGITRTLRQMTGTAEAIAEGRFETPVHAPRSDELGRLGTALNHMSARLREFFTGQKRFLGDIAHELCSPLARMEMALAFSSTKPTRPSAPTSATCARNCATCPGWSTNSFPFPKPASAAPTSSSSRSCSRKWQAASSPAKPRTAPGSSSICPSPSRHSPNPICSRAPSATSFATPSATPSRFTRAATPIPIGPP